MANEFLRSLTPHDVLEVFRRHRKKTVVFPLVVITLGVLVVLYFPRTYRSQAQFFLRNGRESVGLDPTATTGHTISLQQGDRKDEVKSVIEVIKSRGVISQVVDKLGPDVILGHGEAGQKPGFVKRTLMAPLHAVSGWLSQIDPVSDREKAINHAEKHLYVNAERGSTLIDVFYEAKSPQMAQTICDAFIDVYRQAHMRIQRSDESRPFFEEQQRRLRGQLDTALTSLQQEKNKIGITDIVARRASLEAQFNAVELDRLGSQQQLATSDARVADLQQQLTKIPDRLLASKKAMPNVGADLLRDQLYTLQMKSADLEARYTGAHPRVKAVNDQLKDAEHVLAGQAGERLETTDDINPVYRQLELSLTQERNVLAGLKARLTQLDTQSQRVLVDLRTLNGSELTIDQLNREAELARDKYYQYAKNFEEARVDKALENDHISNLSVVQPAALMEKPVTPSKPLVALGTLLVATAGTVVIVMASEWRCGGMRIGGDKARESERPAMGARRSGFGREVAAATATGSSTGA